MMIARGSGQKKLLRVYRVNDKISTLSKLSELSYLYDEVEGGALVWVITKVPILLSLFRGLVKVFIYSNPLLLYAISHVLRYDQLVNHFAIPYLCPIRAIVIVFLISEFTPWVP